MNKRIFFFLSMKRSGQHAVINWICHQNPRDILFINNNYMNKNNFGITERKHVRYEIFSHNNNKKKMEVNRYVKEQKDFNYSLLFNETMDLAFNFEDHSGLEVTKNNIEKDFIKPENEIIFIIIVRDPYNWMASSEQSHANKRTSIKERKKRWKNHMEICLGTLIFPYDFICINFNKWFVDKKYRMKLTNRLGLIFNDRGKEEMTHESSFDNFNFQNKASQMKVLERWKSDKKCTSLVDREMKIYSKEYFGFSIE